MSQIARSLPELIGHTPLLELGRIALAEGVGAQIVAKLEYFNPAGSVKDRVALSMIEALEQQGTIFAGSTLIEPTSGNTGVGLAMVSASRGYRLILTMPESMSIERRRLLLALGAELVLTPAALGMRGAIERAFELQSQIEGSVILNQFENPACPEAHYQTTAEEIWADSDAKVDIVVAGVGTGGTISGVGARLKELKPSVEIVAVEPALSPVLGGGVAAPHKIQGIGAGFIPRNYHPEVVDRVVAVEDMAAIEMARKVAKIEGLLVGVSSGAVLCAAIEIGREPQNRGKQIVVILPDSGERYLSTQLFE